MNETTINKILECNTKELIIKATKESWSNEKLLKWLKIKEVQCLEKLAFKKLGGVL